MNQRNSDSETDAPQSHALLHSVKESLSNDEANQSGDKRGQAPDFAWCVAKCPIKLAAQKNMPWDVATKQAGKHKASIRATVKPPFRAIKPELGHIEVRGSRTHSEAASCAQFADCAVHSENASSSLAGRHTGMITSALRGRPLRMSRPSLAQRA